MGKEKQKRRTQNIVDFHDDDRVRVLLASDAGGVGLNLQRAANCCINIELPWNPAVLEQRVGRIYRLGQNKHVSVYNLVNEEGIEARIAALVGSKRALSKGLFDSESNEIKYEEGGRLMSQLEKLVEPVIVPGLKKLPEIGEEDFSDTDGDQVTDQLEDDEEVLPDQLSGAHADTQSSDSVNDQWPEAVLESLQIERMGAGELRIKAKPEAISTLAALFENLARQLRNS